MKKFWQNYSLSIILFLLFILSWLGQGIFQWQEFVKEEQEHNQSATFQEFVPPFLSSTLENWQSEFLQLFSFVVLATYFIHKGSPQSKDGDEEMQKKLEKIEKKLDSQIKKKITPFMLN